ncbi:MAG: DUF4381 family protein [Deltaproteobacteria bacterium]|jgi:hypothetical protein|nr:DUF4381 family protein [Deltaproteobacteria bacterium]
MTPNTFKLPAVWAIPVLLAFFFLADGLAWGALSSNSVTQQPLSNVVSAPIPSKSSCPLALSTGPKGDIRDIRGPIHIPDPRLWLFYTLGGILLLLLAWMVWRWFNKRKLHRSREAFEIAFEELEKAKTLMKPEMAEGFSVMVSRTIRTYIETRFRMRATRKTTREFMAQMATESGSELNLQRKPLREFLCYCDLAKFARQTLSHEQMKKMHQSAWQFVDKTRPQPATEGGR